MATLKVGTAVKLNYDALSPGTVAYWRLRAGENAGTITFAFTGAEYRVEFPGGHSGTFPAYALTAVEPVQPGLFEEAQ